MSNNKKENKVSKKKSKEIISQEPNWKELYLKGSDNIDYSQVYKNIYR